MAQLKFKSFKISKRTLYSIFTIATVSFLTGLILSLIIPATPVHSKEETKAKPQKSWQLICPKKKPPCHLYAFIKTDNNVIASSVSLLNLKVRGIKNKQTIAIVMLPLGLHIPSGVTIKIDEQITFTANLIECKTKGCRAMFPVSDKVLNHMIIGDKIKVVIVDSKSRKPLTLRYSLKGFGKSYKAFLATLKKSS